MHNRNEAIRVDGRGVKCDWRFTSELDIANVYPGTGRRLMRLALRDWPVVLRDAPRDTAGAPEVSFLVGHRGLSRLPNLLATLRSIAGQTGAAVECIVVEQSATVEIREALPEWVRYVHTPVAAGIPYCRAATFNEAARIARGQMLVLHDNDMLVPERYAAELLARVADGFVFVDLKRFTFYLSESETHRVFGGGPLVAETAVTIVQNLKGGSVAATSDAYAAVGGFDEDFIGWGGEDLEFWERASAHGGVYEFGYLPMIHLWHAAQPEKLSGEAPARRLYEELHRVPASERIRRLRERSR